MNCARTLLALGMVVSAGVNGSAAEHPRLLFQASDLPALRQKAQHPRLQAVTQQLLERAAAYLQATPLQVSLAGRGQPDPPGELKGLTAARRLQGRVLTFCMAYTLKGDRRFLEAAVHELDHALENWKIWVDTAHQPPYDLMTGETCMTFGLAYDWLYNDLTAEQRQRIAAGVIRRGLRSYLDALGRPKPPGWSRSKNNWNPVCHGGATVCALALEGEYPESKEVLRHSVSGMDSYWEFMAEDGACEEGTGYWTYGNRYGFLAAEALRRCGKAEGSRIFERLGSRNTAYFPIVFAVSRNLSAGFGDSNSVAGDPLFYLLGKEYRNPDFIWYKDRQEIPEASSEGWPQEALILLWRPVDQSWLPESTPNFVPRLESTVVFSSIGWGIMAPKLPDPPFFLAFKNGSLAAGHTHLDLNHINVGYGETMLAVELGSRSYPADYFSSKRYSYYELSTPGHNTVLIGGKGQVPQKKGTLTGPIRGDLYMALSGSAAGAYEVPVERAQRQAVFVDNRFWLLVDDIAAEAPQPIELRFHTYGNVRERKDGGWTFERDAAALEIVPANPESVRGEIQTPTGWIRPVRVLSLKSTSDRREHLQMTVLYPHAAGADGPGTITSRRDGQDWIVRVGNYEIYLTRKTAGTWIVDRVRRAS